MSLLLSELLPLEILYTADSCFNLKEVVFETHNKFDNFINFKVPNRVISSSAINS